MSRVLNPHPEGGRNWALALGLSVALHAGAVVYAMGVISFGNPNEAPPVSFPDIAISNTVLEQQQLAALSPDETVEEPSAEEAEELEADRLDPADAETAEEAEPEELEQAEAEALDEAEAEEIEPAAPEEVAQTDEAEALEAVESEELAALEPEALEQAAPEQLNPILPDNPEPEAATPAPDTQRLTPVAPDDGTSLQGATALAPVAPPSVEAAPVVTAVQPVTRVAPVASPPRPTPPPPPAAAAPPPSPEDLAVLELIERIRNRFGDECLIALPQNQGPGLNPLVTLISDQERAMSTFVDEVLSDPDLPVDDRRVLVDSRQCAALDYARAHRNYPAFRIDLTLQSRVIADGNNIRGRVSGFGGRYMSLLAVDSNGVVTDLRRFSQFRQGTAELDAPVNINGQPRDTSHLLIAIATNGLPSTVAQRAGWLAEDFFPLLREETEGGAVIAVLPFDVR